MICLPPTSDRPLEFWLVLTGRVRRGVPSAMALADSPEAAVAAAEAGIALAVAEDPEFTAEVGRGCLARAQLVRVQVLAPDPEAAQAWMEQAAQAF